MVQHPDNSPKDSLSLPAAESPQPPTGRRSASSGRILLFGVVGIVAGLLGVFVIHGIGEVFRLPNEIMALGIGAIPGPEAQAKIIAGNAVLKYKHYALWFGVVGAMWAGLFGLIASRSGSSGNRLPSRVLAIVKAVVLGGVFGALGGLISNFSDIQIHENIPAGQLSAPEHWIFVLHGITWLVVGTGVGLGAATGSAGNRCADIIRCSIVTASAGTLGGILYPLLAAFILPAVDVTIPIPDDTSARLLWMELPALLIGLALGRQAYPVEGSQHSP